MFTKIPKCEQLFILRFFKICLQLETLAKFLSLYNMVDMAYGKIFKCSRRKQIIIDVLINITIQIQCNLQIYNLFLIFCELRCELTCKGSGIVYHCHLAINWPLSDNKSQQGIESQNEEVFREKQRILEHPVFLPESLIEVPRSQSINRPFNRKPTSYLGNY